jgi:hypothetical protein
VKTREAVEIVSEFVYGKALHEKQVSQVVYLVRKFPEFYRNEG